MKLKKEDYILERTADGGYYAYLSYNMQCGAYGDIAEEAVDNLEDQMDDYVSDMFLVEEFI